MQNFFFAEQTNVANVFGNMLDIFSTDKAQTPKTESAHVWIINEVFVWALKATESSDINKFAFN